VWNYEYKNKACQNYSAVKVPKAELEINGNLQQMNERKGRKLKIYIAE
jgi:hypothetical protein